MRYQTLMYKRRDNVAMITFNRPSVMNAINRQLQSEWLDALDEAERDSTVRAIIVTGVGKSFSSGHDLKENLAKPTVGSEGWRTALGRSMRIAMRIWNLNKPVIAAVNGYCLGEANHIAQACDIVLASEEAVFGDPEVRFVAASSFPILPWMVRMRKAKELMLTGDMIHAREAERIGLVNKVVAPDRLQAEALGFAEKIAKIPPTALMLNKRSINRILEVSGFSGALIYNLEYVSTATSIAAEVQEHAEFMRTARERGLKAAFEERDAPFRGEQG